MVHDGICVKKEEEEKKAGAAGDRVIVACMTLSSLQCCGSNMRLAYLRQVLLGLNYLWSIDK